MATTKNKNLPNQKSAAILTLNNVPNMTLEGRTAIAQWLKRQADDLINLGQQYSKKCIARYYY
jgi:hypothetical protein